MTLFRFPPRPGALPARAALPPWALLAATLMSVPPSAAANAASPEAGRSALRDPLDATAPVPPLRHEATLSRLPRPAEPPAVPWREANETVLRHGGWRALLREAQRARAAEAAAATAPQTGGPTDAAAPAAPAAPAEPAARPPRGHHHHHP